LSCFVGPIEMDGRRTRAAALPVRISRDGVAKAEVPVLTASARIALDNAMLL
jgi:hypothetical protein